MLTPQQDQVERACCRQSALLSSDIQKALRDMRYGTLKYHLQIQANRGFIITKCLKCRRYNFALGNPHRPRTPSARFKRLCLVCSAPTYQKLVYRPTAEDLEQMKTYMRIFELEELD